MSIPAGWFFQRFLGPAIGIIAVLVFVSASSAWPDTFSLSDGTNLITFSLSPNPAPASFKTGSFTVFDEVPVIVNGTSEGETAIFFNSGSGGGMGIAGPTSTLLNQSGPMIYGGSEQSPLFTLGSFSLKDLGGAALGGNFTLTISDPQSTPEPSTWSFVGIGLLILFGAGTIRNKLPSR